MSQLGGGNSERAGGIHFDVDVRGAAPAAAEVQKVSQEVNKLGQQAQQVTPKLEDVSRKGFAGWTRSLKDSTKVFRDGIGAITGFVGKVTGLIGLFGLVTGAVYGVVKGIGALWDGLVRMDSRLKAAPENWQKVIDKHSEYLAILEKIIAVQGKVQPGSTAEALIKNVDKARVEALSNDIKKDDNGIYSVRDRRIEELEKRIQNLQKNFTADEMLSYMASADDLARQRGISRMQALQVLGGQQGQSSRNVPGTMAVIEQLSFELVKLRNDRAFLSGFGQKSQRAEQLVDAEVLAAKMAERLREAFDDARSGRNIEETLYSMNERLIGIESRLGGGR